MAFTPKSSVAIILVNWNGYAFTAACLKSLRAVNSPDHTIIVVDNASENQEGQRLKHEFPEIQLIENTENLGFSGGNNVGIIKALKDKYTHIMLLNNDTEVTPNFLKLMLLPFSLHKNIGAVQPLILFLHDKNKIWSAGGKWNGFLGRAMTRGDRKYKVNYQAADSELDWATGCCMLISREAILETGLLNEQYFAYFEDVEWSLRFREKGYKIILAANAEIFHEAGASSKKKHSEGTLSPRVFYYHVRNQFFLLRSQVNGISFLFAFLYHIARFKIWMSYFLVRGRFQKLKAVLKGIMEGCTIPLKKNKIWP